MSALVVFLAGQAVGMATVYFIVVRPLLRGHKTASEYAIERADFTEAGRAYSDMATVLTLSLDKGGCDTLRSARFAPARQSGSTYGRCES